MSQHHRHNPDSPENEAMTRDNELAVKVAIHMARTCLRCGMTVAPDYPKRDGLCESCDYEDRQAEIDAKEDE